MSTLKERISGSMQQVGVGGVAALAAGAVLIAGVTAVGAANGADDRPSATPVTVSMPGDDDGTPDQGSGDAPGTPGAPSTTVGTIPTTVPAPSSTVPAPSTLRTVPVPGVGEVVVDDATLALVSATPAPGFTVRSESSARELHVRFFAPDGGRIDVQVEYEDGGVRVRVRDRRLEGDGSGRGRGGESPSTTTMPAATPAPGPAVDDHGGDHDRDDRVEVGDDRADRSGSGSGSDDDHDDDHDDDRSGHGGDDD
jgi:hypothetical protein